ncbi:hypothetical protein GGQ60_003802 [Pedobacter zeae]|uniref:Uncharacterized protein n=1 Tax=Pedobacter zeae TaxID=1737356 RepID=A0A7W6P7E0_9SPHI|nr:hypothetical protein [Pedobacter zeae]
MILTRNYKGLGNLLSLYYLIMSYMLKYIDLNLKYLEVMI